MRPSDWVTFPIPALQEPSRSPGLVAYSSSPTSVPSHLPVSILLSKFESSRNSVLHQNQKTGFHLTWKSGSIASSQRSALCFFASAGIWYVKPMVIALFTPRNFNNLLSLLNLCYGFCCCACFSFNCWCCDLLNGKAEHKCWNTQTRIVGPDHAANLQRPWHGS